MGGMHCLHIFLYTADEKRLLIFVAASGGFKGQAIVSQSFNCALVSEIHRFFVRFQQVQQLSVFLG